MSLRSLALAAFLIWSCGFPAEGGTTDLQQRVDQLERMVSLLQQRLEALEGAPVRTGVAPAPGRIPEPTAASPASATALPAPAAAQETRPGPVNSGLTIGPMQFNGEFRLYFDSITRPAGGGAPRVSNIRGRYLLHLDMEAALRKSLTVHAQLSTAPLTNPLTDIQDFGGGAAKHPFFLSKAYVDYHPNEYVRLQGGRLENPFGDRSRFLFDSDTRFNGTNQMFRIPLRNTPAGITEIQFMAGQYTFTDPNFPIITPGTPSTAANATPSQAFLAAGAVEGTQPRSSQLFHQGFLVRQRLTNAWTDELTADVQLYRNPNQLRLMSTPGGLFLIGNSLGLTLSGGVASASNATTTPTGATLSTPGFRIGHLSYTLANRGLNILDHSIPLSLNLQYARNLEPASDRNAAATIVTAGRANEAGDLRLTYGYYRKEANSMIGELTENDIAVGGNVNMSAHLIRIDYTLGRGVVFANNLIWTHWLKDSNPGANFFVPFGSMVPGQFRYQGMLIFRF